MVHYNEIPDSKVYGANMGPTWVLSARDEPQVSPMNAFIWDITQLDTMTRKNRAYTLNSYLNNPCLVAISKLWGVYMHVMFLKISIHHVGFSTVMQSYNWCHDTKSRINSTNNVQLHSLKSQPLLDTTSCITTGICRHAQILYYVPTTFPSNHWASVSTVIWTDCVNRIV